MTTLLLDANVWLSAVDPSDPHHSASTELIELGTSGRFTTATLDLTLYEVANVARTSWRDDAIGPQLAERIEVACVGRIVRAVSDLIKSANLLAAEHEITVYDAAYVAASQSLRWPLVSCDVRDLVSKDLAVLPGDALN